MARRHAKWLLIGALVAFWLGADLWLRCIRLDGGNQPFWSQLYTKSVLLTVAGAFYEVTLLGLAGSVSMTFAVVLALVVALGHTVDVFANFFASKYFYTYLTQFHLDFVAKDPTYIANYLKTYPDLGNIGVAAVVCLFFGGVALGAARVGTEIKWRRSLVSLGVVGVAYALIFDRMTVEKRHFALLPNINTNIQIARYFATIKRRAKEPFFQRTLDPHPSIMISPGTVLVPAMKTVVLVVNESWGTDFFPDPKRGPQGMPLLASRIASEPSSYLVFRNAFSNTTATDVSWPALLTGVGPEESATKLGILPLVSNLAASCSFRTAFFSSQRLEWAGIFDFVASNFGTIRGAKQLGLPIVNDLGIDDGLLADRVSEFVTDEVDPDTSLFLIIGTNALHHPYQQDSVVAVEDAGLSRYEKAMRILDGALDRMLASLAAAGRYDDALIIITGDHGEGMLQPNSVHRITSFYDYFAKVPFVVKLPRGTTEELRLVIAANAERNVQNLDIAPTMAHLFGMCGDAGAASSLCASYRGTSLFRAIDPNRAIVNLNTNDIRRWDPEGFGIFRNRWRVLFSSTEPRLQAFDILADPDEKNDLWRTFTESQRRPYEDVIKSEAHLSRIFAAYGGKL